MTPRAPASVSSLQRRSSVYSRPSSTGPMGHQSFFAQAPIPASAPQDPRPLRNGAYQAKIGQEMLDYLTQNNFELEMKHSLRQNMLKSPTTNDFNMIFQWLYHRIDPAYRFQKTIDAEVPPILKQLRYPYIKNISKSQLAAPGGQNWSTFLGLLHWMMQLAQMLDRYEAGEYDEACAEAGIDVSGDRIIFRFLSGAYRDWLQVDDADDENDDADKLLVPHIEAMAAEFERGNQRYSEELRILEAENAALNQQIEEAEKGAPDLAKLEKHFQILEDDKKKFEDYNANVEGKVEKYEMRIKFLTEEIERTETELKEAEQEKTNLQETVDRLGITIHDIDHMNSERERLQKAVESIAVKLDEVKKRSTEREFEANRTLEDLERVVEKYNSLCYQIGLIPSNASNAKGEEYELRLSTSSSPFSSSQFGSQQSNSDRLLAEPATGYNPAYLLNLDVRGTVKSRFVKLRKEISERRTVAIDADMKNHELLDSIKEAIDDKKTEVETLEHRVRAAEEEFEKTKEVGFFFAFFCFFFFAIKCKYQTANKVTHTGDLDAKASLGHTNREDGKRTRQDARRPHGKRPANGTARNEHQHRVCLSSFPPPFFPPSSLSDLPLKLTLPSPNNTDTNSSPCAPTPCAKSSIPEPSASSTISSASRCTCRRASRISRAWLLRRSRGSWGGRKGRKGRGRKGG